MASMNRPLGSFVAADTPLARIDARVKLALLLALTVLVFVLDKPWAIAVVYLVLIAAMRLARMSAKTVAATARPVSVILAFTLLANLVSCDGTGAVEVAGAVSLDPAGGLRGLLAVLRIVALLGFSLCVSASTTPPQISDACIRLMSPLARLGVPVADIGSVLSLALRFISVVGEEFQRIQLAQRARGVDFDRGGLGARIRVWTSVFTPLIVGLFRRADRLAESMAARCYAEGSVAVPRPAPLAARDRAILLVGLACMVALGAACAL